MGKCDDNPVDDPIGDLLDRFQTAGSFLMESIGKLINVHYAADSPRNQEKSPHILPPKQSLFTAPVPFFPFSPVR
jgi:hypothetical protein